MTVLELCLIGEGSLVVRCGELLMAKGHQIRAIVSSDVVVRSWATKVGVLHYERNEVLALERELEFDILFSIGNYTVLSDAFLKLAKRMSINYHYGPLPEYSGLHVPSWAVFEQASEYSITWHRIGELVDGGAVLKRIPVPIEPSDTALSLGLKCDELAIQSLDSLIEELAEGRETQVAQDLSKRRYFSRHSQFPAEGLIDWNQNAEQIAALIRAADYGPFSSPLVWPKVIIKDQFFAVRGASVGITSIEAAVPGEIETSNNSSVLLVSTASGRIHLESLCSLEGKPLVISDFAKTNNLKSGVCLDYPSETEKVTLTNIGTTVSKSALSWREQLLDFNPYRFPYSPPLAAGVEANLLITEKCDVPLDGFGFEISHLEYLVSGCCTFLARASGVSDIHLAVAALRDEVDPAYRDLFLPWVPLLTRVDVSVPIAENIKVICCELRKFRKQGLIRRDLIGRELELNKRFENGELAPDIVISWDDRLPAYSAYDDRPALELVFRLNDCEIDFHYNPKKIAQKDATQLSSQLSEWCLRLPSFIAQPLGSVSVISEKEHVTLVDDFNVTYNNSMLGGCFNEQFDRAVKLHGDKIALLCADVELSYQTLNAKTNQLARILAQQDVGSGDLVGICLERSIDLVVALLAVLKTGAAYVPIDPAFPSDRIHQMIDDANPVLLITSGDVLDDDRFGPWPKRCLNINKIQDEANAEITENLDVLISADDLAYVIYTSGSTGKPKGVEVTHEALCNFLLSMQQQPGCHETDRLLAVTTISFDIAVLELFLPLLCGARVIIAKPHEIIDGNALLALLQNHSITMMQATPATWQLLIQSGWKDQASLSKILCGGEALSPRLADQLAARCDTVWNMYGPTETTVWSSLWQIRKGEPIIIGKPIANTQLYVLDENLSPVPSGFVGELCIGGVGVARSYHNNPKQTKERFFPNPFHPGTLYRTGDLARFIEPGKLSILGRNDRQIKIRGFRIEIGEVEAAISRHPDISNTVVSGRNDQLVAYCLRELLLPSDTSQSFEAENSTVSEWSGVWDRTYETGISDPTFNIAGWQNSYDGLPFAHDEMRDWQKSSVDKILSYSPQRIFEIGSGSGLMLFGIAHHCSTYRASDVSQQAVELIQQHLPPSLSHVTCEHRPANDLPEVEAGDFDTIIINSVVQYFPSIEYLMSVLEWATSAISQGRIFIGDVRNLAFLKIFHTDIAQYHGKGRLDNDELKQRAQRALQSEHELVIEPEFFSNLPTLLPQISCVDITLRNGNYVNEMTRYRYDVTLHIGGDTPSQATQIGTSVQDWQDTRLNLVSLRRRLEADNETPLRLTNVPNGRLSAVYKSVSTVLESQTTEMPFPWIAPQDIQNVAQEVGLEVAFLPSRSDNIWAFDTVFWRASELPDLTWHSPKLMSRDLLANYANVPAINSQTKVPLGRLLKPWLEERLPAYMLPSFFVELAEFPLTPNGKIDRQALPDPVESSSKSVLRPTNELEKDILAIWTEVLGHDKIGINESFFEIGGNSLRVVRVQSELEQLLGHSITAATLYEFFTIKALAGYLSGNKNTPSPALPKPFLGGHNEEIAVVSMACRLPGNVHNPEDFWSLLERGGDGIVEVPKDRWDADALYDPDPDARGKAYCRKGGFVYPIDVFDASFFGISPREARALDPAQRLMLETSWEAFEQAGYSMQQLRGSQTGVFVGVGKTAYHDYGLDLAGGLADLDGYFGTGSAAATMSGRLSYVLGLEGPSLTVDTACSSSLVAAHQACNALRQGECDLALAAGVTVMLSPDLHVEFSRLRGMAPDGRCKSFSSSADGTGWSEGATVVVLKRLSDAKRDGDQILAILRGTAVNHAGHSASLTTPSGPAQQRVINQALANSNLVPKDIDYVEAHGTGTKLGDPIEATALAKVFGGSHSEAQPLWVGSVKSNIGHTQAAAGLAGVIKIILAMHHDKLPRTLHVDEPSPSVDWHAAHMTLVQEEQRWRTNGRPRRAGVSSFGISGTNAHVIVEEPPKATIPESTVNSTVPMSAPLPFLISGFSESALRAQADKLHLHMGMNIEDRFGDVAYSLATTRTHFRKRLVLLAKNKSELLDALALFSRTGETPVGAARTTENYTEECSCALLFSGQGSQRPKMGQNLYNVNPVFRAALDEIVAHFSDLERPLLDVMWADANSDEATLLNRTDFTQPALFALEVALWRLWESWGVQPSLLLGHSIGELSAAHVAGVFSLADACLLVAARGKLMQALPSGGAMASLEANGTEVQAAIDLLKLTGNISIAALNSPQQTVVSGNSESVETVVEYFGQQQRKVKRLSVSHAFHSHLMDGMLTDFKALAETISYTAPQIPLVSSLTGVLAKAEEITQPEYWVRQARETVQFNASIRTLYDQGIKTFLELGPQPVLSGLGANCLADEKPVSWLTSLKSGQDDVWVMRKSLAELHVLGVPLDWRGYFAPFGGERVQLPSYAFQRERFWLEPPASREIGAGLTNTNHLLLGGGTQIAGTGMTMFTTVVSSEEPIWVKEHQVMDAVLMPGTAFFEAMRAAGNVNGKDSWDVSDVIILAPLVLSPGVSVRMQVTVSSDSAGERLVQVYSVSESESDNTPWQLHAEGKLVAAEEGNVSSVELPPVNAKPLDASALYNDLAELGYGYGPTFQGINEVWHVGDVVWARVALPENAEPSAMRYGLHPALLDSAMHSLLFTQRLKDQNSDALYVPFEAERLSLWQEGLSELWVKVAEFEMGDGEFWASIDLYDKQGAGVGRLHKLHARRIERAALRRLAIAGVDRFQFEMVWRNVNSTLTEASRTWGLLHRGHVSWASDVQASLVEAGVQVVEISEIYEAQSLDGVICLWGNKSEVIAETHTLSALALTQLQELALAEFQMPVVWITCGAIGTGNNDRVPNLGTSPLWGMMRTARNEHPELMLRCIDVGEDPSDITALALALGMDGEPECALRDGQVLSPRLARANEARGLVIPKEGMWRLEIAAKGRLDEPLTLQSITEEPLAVGEIRATVKATGVNFLDVLNALGMVEIPAFGLEFAGVVRDIGTDVKGLSVGDRVLGLARGSFASDIVMDARQVVRIPDNLSFEEAATIPMAFLTAWYGLHVLGKIQPKEKVLIHSAAGGVGMAAVQLAQLHGAEVYGTASEPKWSALRELGLDDDHIASSRNLDFVDHFSKTVPTRGFDVVLNSLAQEFIDASLALLGNGGRFLELGKIDVREQSWIGAHYPGVTYRVYNLPEAGPDLIQEMLLSLSHLFASGKLKPLPRRTFPMKGASDALRFMAQARHVGKIVLIPAQQQNPLQTDGAVLITGGVGGLGKYIAKWLVTEHGVKDLMLTSRRGLETPQAETFVNELTELCATATVVTCDVSDLDGLTEMMTNFTPERPLRGVVHTAGVLDDGVLTALTPARIDSVFSPKLDGAWNLHTLTQDLELDFFVVYSSIAGIMGAPGQANYAAANAFLDALAHHRRAKGLPASSVAWGSWDGKQGMHSALSESDQTRMSRQGFDSITPEEGLELFDAAVTSGRPLTVASAFNLTRLQNTFEEHGREAPPLLRKLFNASDKRAQGRAESSSKNLRKILSETAPEEYEAVVLQMVREEVAKTLEFSSPDDVDVHLPLQDLGIDSLTAVLMRNQLADMTGLALPAKIAFDHPNLRALGQYILEKILELGLEVASTAVDEVDDVSTDMDAASAKQGRLDSTIQFQNAATVSNSPEAVFVTGATGFVGAFLLHELLKSNLTVYCLVRANSVEHAAQRVKETLEAYGLWARDYAGLLNPIVGDLAQPFFGLSEDKFDQIAEQVDTICHSGAVVDWMLPLEIYLGPNVVGTHEVLRLASRGRGKAIHYISTYATLPKYMGYEIPEDYMDYGYLTSKWMGEQMVAAARWRGALASVYRLPFVGACSSTGRFRLDRGDFLHNLITGCIELGFFPSTHGTLRCVLPIDYLAKVITQSMTNDLDRIGKNYDFINPKAPTFNSFVEIIRGTGSCIETIPYKEWQTKALEFAKEHQNSSLARISVLVDSITQEDFELMLEGLPVGSDVFGGENYPCPPVDEATVQPYVERITTTLLSSDKKVVFA